MVAVRKPWGNFERFTRNEKTTVKLLHIRAGSRTSYQYHRHRSEYWKVVAGKIRIMLNGRERMLKEGDHVGVPLGAKHRIEGISDSTVLEISYGHFDEGDIIRIDDDYGRA